MKTSILVSAGAALTFALFAPCALAATPTIDVVRAPPQSSHARFYVAYPDTVKAHKVYYFESLDRNHDGQLSRSEIPKDMHDLRIHFVEADWDGNGRLSPDELRHYERGTAPQYAGVYHKRIFVVR